MARTSADQEASEYNRPSPPSRLKAMWLMLMGMFSMVKMGAVSQAQAMTAATRGRLHMKHDTAGAGAITGLIELLVGFIVLIFSVLIGLLLLPLVNNQSAALTKATNTTDQQKSVLPIIGLVMVVALVIMALGFLFAGFKNIIKEFQ